MEEPIWKPHVTVATLVRDEDRYLFVEEEVRGRIVVNQPAGHLEPDESLMAAARRETLEETAYTVELTALVGFYQWKSARGKEFLRAVFSGDVLSHDPERELDEGIIRAVWLTRAELTNGRALRSPMVQLCLDEFEAGQCYPVDLIRNLNL